MATISELEQQLLKEEQKLSFYAPINNRYGGAAYLSQLIFVERLQIRLNKLKQEAEG